MKSSTAQTSARAAAPDGPGAFASFVRFVGLGGGVGVLASLAVPVVAAAAALPWAVANAAVTVVSTLLCTELHARFTFAKGRRAGLREHWQSAGSASAAYLATSLAVLLLHLVHPSPGALTEQAVYLGASALAGAGRFLTLRLYVFATGTRTRARTRTPSRMWRSGSPEHAQPGGSKGFLRGPEGAREFVGVA
ncbi:GtrA family protein [Streptomyces sp. NPDC016845]|uniref:GtrA family protein n=1 Tax=Streptomyces sp. NPDC016845 TaxID=3364972 RepID=UPI0037AF701A